MKNIPIKVDGSSTVNASELNSGWSEEKNGVLDSGQSLIEGDNFQLSRAMAINAAGADYFAATGGPVAYVLTSVGSLRSPEAYYEGQTIRFRPPLANSGGATVNVGGVGTVPILKEDGATALSAGDLTTAQDVICRYDIGAGAFLLRSKAPDATQTSKGIAFLGDQRIILANNGLNDIDFSGGRFIFDDGSGDEIVSALTKQLDVAWSAGHNQGGNVVDTFPSPGVQADTWYHCFAIYNPTNGSRDYAFDTSVTGANITSVATGYTKKYLIESILTNGTSDIIGVLHIGNYMLWKIPMLDYTNNSFGTGASITAVFSFPLGRRVKAFLNYRGDGGTGIYFSSPEVNDVNASTTLAPLASAGGSNDQFDQVTVMTNTLSQIRMNAASLSNIKVVSVMWEKIE